MSLAHATRDENSFAVSTHLSHLLYIKRSASSPPAAITIRDAAANDIEAISAIYAHYVRFGLASFEEAAPSMEEMARRLEDIHRYRLPYLVAEAEARVLGYAYAGIALPRPR